MALGLLGTTLAITWEAGVTNPDPQDITPPSGCTKVLAQWVFYVGAAGNGLSSASLDGAAAAGTHKVEIATAATDRSATGSVVFDNPPTGSPIALAMVWDAIPGEGPLTFVTFIGDADTTSPWVDADAASNQYNGAVSFSLTGLQAGDLVIQLDQRFDGGGTPPGTPSGFTSLQTDDNNSEAGRVSTIVATGTSQACASQATLSYSTLTAVAFRQASGGGGGGAGPIARGGAIRHGKITNGGIIVPAPRTPRIPAHLLHQARELRL